MYRLIAALLLALLTSGCVQIEATYTPETGEIRTTYTRVGSQTVEGFEVQHGRTSVKLKKQASKAEALNHAMKLLEALP